MSNGICCYCLKNSISDIEHCTPLSRGGHNSPENVVMSCAECNRSGAKGSKTVLEYIFGLPKLGTK